jgi:hypothetical protein
MRQQAAVPGVRWLRDRLTPLRVSALAALVGLAVAAVVLGDPLAHPTVGPQGDGTRAVGGLPRTAELLALAIAFVVALPPRDR